MLNFETKHICQIMKMVNFETKHKSNNEIGKI